MKPKIDREADALYLTLDDSGRCGVGRGFAGYHRELQS